MDTGNTAWIITSTALVLFMTLPGLALFYAGLVRASNILSVLMHCFTIACISSIAWLVIAYSIAFSGTGAYVGDLGNLFLANLSRDSMSGDIPESVFFMFQMTFAIITPALIVGAYPERIKFSFVAVFSLLWVILIYAPVVHWIWAEGGWLYEMGVRDFAGGLVVHLTAGITALVIAYFLGPRDGFPNSVQPPHNPGLTMMGACMLWVGWFGFNAGSAVAANGSAAMAMAVTQIATAAAGLAWMFTEWTLRGKPSVLGIISGAIAGLVAITPAAGFVNPVGALCIGIASGIICFWGATWLKRACGYDDSLDVFGIHGIGGIVGALLTGVFASEAIGGTKGLLEGNAGQVVTQAWGIVATIIWCAVASFIILKVIDMVIGLRVSEEVERDGLDVGLHGETIQ